MVSYCYISCEIDDRRLRCIIDLLQARLAWARKRRRYDLRYWRRVHWSDESYFQLQKVDGRVRVWRRPGERFHQECILPRLVSGRVSVSVWGCMSWLQAGANGYPGEYDWDKIPGWNTGNTSGTTNRRASLGSSSMIYAWRSVDAYFQSLLGIPQSCRHRCHAVAVYEPRPQHYWTFVGPHHQRTEPDGKQTPECCRTSQCHSRHLAEHHTGTDPETADDAVKLW